MAHHVWADPRHALGFHILIESTTKIEAIAMTSLNNVRLQHIGRAQTPSRQKLRELVRQWDSSRVAILRPKRRCCADFNGSPRKVKPLRNGFDDFELSHAHVKTAK